jgi:hypothetical protein
MLAKAAWHNTPLFIAATRIERDQNSMVEVFKTDVGKSKEVILLALLETTFPHCRINFDLEDCDRVLRVEGQNICSDTVISLLNTHGCYCAILE